MCGGIISALSLSLPTDVQKNRRRLFPYLLTYSSGRIASYAVAGLMAGAVSGNLFQAISPTYGNTVLRWIAAIVLVALGLQIGGWFPRLFRLERLGRPIWQRIEPYGRKLLPVKSPTHAFFFGTIWGWLPCGLVYTTLIWAGTSGGAYESAMLMTAFGLGTLPSVLATGMLTGSVLKFARSSWFKQLAGILLVGMAVFSIVYGWQHQNHNDHLEPTSIGESSHEHVTQHLPGREF